MKNENENQLKFSDIKISLNNHEFSLKVPFLVWAPEQRSNIFEQWFDKFQFGDFLTKTVNWSPKVVGRTQRKLWDFKEDKLDD